ncbi:MAG: bifunctional nuclease family protein [Planctomycetota bacterium]|nr:bifunctional nuclease family protein [Planctomycetota bacterium]
MWNEPDQSEWIECELAQILMMTDALTSPQVIVLREKRGVRTLMLHIGLCEALAINRRVHGEAMTRPMTHDLMQSMVEALGARVARMAVSALKEDGDGNGTYYGFIVLERDGMETVVDCRPSDGVALAVRAECPIFVAGAVLDAVAGER